MNSPNLKQPVVFLPLAMSLTAFALVLVHFLALGLVHEADEGTAAHIFQLLIVAQVPFIIVSCSKVVAVGSAADSADTCASNQRRISGDLLRSISDLVHS